MADDYDEVEHRKLMYAHFGAAFYLANCFEHGLAIALMFVDFLSHQQEIIRKEGMASFNREKYEREFDAFFDDQFAQTMGNLLRRLGKVVTLTPEFEGLVRKTKVRRDYLSHHFFRDHAESVLTRAGLDKMIAELEEDQELFKLVDQRLDELMKPVRRRLGIKDEWLQKHFEKEMERIIRDDSGL